ncbi:hypothetical protein [Allosalinactinospora lopnorensis]|uniref:hypothetical protein n=1 Tax=Allosalinactinospora lopnorensis TaxID=1352348 RepID=UPI000623F4E5|nr:hypothetical protein [Allosalinactinospora lopnorensis]
MFESLDSLYFVLLALLVAANLFFLVNIVHPRLSWVLTKWQYRDPEAVEPSRVVFELRRVKYTVLFIVFTVGTVTLWNVRDGLPGS